MKKRNRSTLEDVARMAGVSTATASRCLNQPDIVSPLTRQRVEAAVKALHYAPNFGARAIAANRTRTYGAIIPTMENAIFARGIESFQNKLMESGATMLLATSGYNPEREEQLIRTLVARGADGILLIGTERAPSAEAFLEAQGIPYIICWAKAEPIHQSFVGFDNFEASKEMALHALSLGHRQCAFISAIREGNDRARARIDGAKDAMAEFGLKPDDLPILEVPYAIDKAEYAVTQLLKQQPNITLILCGNDVLAVGALKAAQKLGIKVPDELSITGFDDIELAAIMDPPLTTVHVPHKKMGTLAAEALLAMAEGPNMAIRTLLPTHIVERKSLAPAK